MHWFIQSFPGIIMTVGLIDAIVVLVVGIVAAIFWLFNVTVTAFWSRVMPATAVLIGTSIGAGIILAITRWIVVTMA